MQFDATILERAFVLEGLTNMRDKNRQASEWALDGHHDFPDSRPENKASNSRRAMYHAAKNTVVFAHDLYRLYVQLDAASRREFGVLNRYRYPPLQ